jgi:hypothetical protein
VDVVDVAERLMAEFEDRLGLHVISGVVNQCRRELGGSAGAALPELLEQQSRERLLEVVRTAVPAPRTPSAGAGS